MPTSAPVTTLASNGGSPLSHDQMDANWLSLQNAAQLAASSTDLAASAQSTINAVATSITSASTAATNRANHTGFDSPNLVSQTLTNRTLVLADFTEASCIETNLPTANTVTLPLASAVPVPQNARAYVAQMGLGATTLVAPSGVTLIAPYGYSLQLAGQGCEVCIRNRGTNSFVVGPASSLLTTVQAGGGTGGPVAPVNTVAASIAGTSTAGSTLTRTAGTWTGSPSITGQWYANGLAIAGATGTTYVTLTGQVGQNITYQETGAVTGLSPVVGILSNAITVTAVAASAPTNSAAPPVTGTFAVGNSLTIGSGVWTGSPTSYTYTIYLNGVLQSTVGPTASTSTTFALTTAASGAAFQAFVTATNGTGTSAAAPSVVYNIPGAAPVISNSGASAPAWYDTTNAFAFLTGDTIACDTGAWANNPTFILVITRTNPLTNVQTVVQNSSTLTYTLQGADAGCIISGVLTGTTTGGSNSQGVPGFMCTSSASLPVNTVLPVISGTGAVGQVLTVTSNGTWSPSGSFTYQWNSNGTPISGATGSTYTIGAPYAGTNITCTVDCTNAGLSAFATSNTIAVSGAGGGSISISNNAGAGGINLTTEGTIGWVAYPGNGSTTPVVMSGGASITVNDVGSSLPLVGTTAYDYTQFSWSNGVSPASGSGLYGVGTSWGAATGTGRTWQTPLNGTATRVVNLYCALYNQGVTITVTLSDSSASPVTQTFYSAANSSNTNIQFQVSANAGTTGQTMTISATTNQGALGAGLVDFIALDVPS